jgi:hypothetical protein
VHDFLYSVPAILKVRNFSDSQISGKMIELNRYAVWPSLG